VTFTFHITGMSLRSFLSLSLHFLPHPHLPRLSFHHQTQPSSHLFINTKASCSYSSKERGRISVLVGLRKMKIFL
jgi:hypothetical protein